MVHQAGYTPAWEPHTALQALQAAPRKPGEARFFWFDHHFQRLAVKVLPGEYALHKEDVLIMTVLGSCIACCLWDREARVGGMNHFMLPGDEGACGRYGAFAMQRLIHEMLELGARRSGLEAKLFGGGKVMAGMDSMNVGERNTRYAINYLRTERIPLVSQDVLDSCPRQLAFAPSSGKAMVKRLADAPGPVPAEAAKQSLPGQRRGLAGKVALL